MNKLYCLLLASLCCLAGRSQQQVGDSPEQQITRMKDDTAKVNRLNDLVGKLQFSDPQKATAIAAASMQLAIKLDYQLGLAIAYRLVGVMYVDRMVLDSGKLFYDKAFAIVKDSKDKAFQKQVGLLDHNYGTIYHKKQEYDSAVSKYIEAIRVFTEGKNEGFAYFPYNNLSALYSYLKNNEKSLFYAKGAVASARKLNDPNKIVGAVNAEISARMELNQYDSVLIPLQQNMEQALLLHNYYQQGTTANLLARYYGYGRKQYDSSVWWVKKAVEAMQKANNEFEGTNMIHNLGYFYKQAGKTDSALVYLKMAIDKGKALGLDYVVQYSLENLVELEEGRGNKNAAFDYLIELNKLKDSINVKTNSAQVNELEAKYQAEKKDNLIKLQHASIQRKNIVNSILIGGAILFLLIALLSYRTYRQKQKLQQQRINELEKEKQLTATEAVLKGEEQERTRLAKDLHDGLGGMLSGIKHSLSTMKGNMIMTPDNQLAFERSMDMLDSSIREMRRVAHNMMPESLVKFGLNTALKDFCNDINQSGALKVSYQSFGLEDAFVNQSTSVAIYRIVQELINNTIKHAGARTAIVQVSKSGNQVSLTVEDDGKGFNPVILQSGKGIGWSNIQSRIEYLKGKLDVQSEPGKGTSVQIDLTA